MTPARYSRWDGSQDPWADADALLDSLSDDVLEFGDLQQALRRMLQRGFDLDGRRITGVQSLAERLRALRRHELQAHDMDSVVSGIEDALREVREMESREVDERMRLRDEEHPGGSGRSVPAADDPLDALEREMARPPFGPRLDVRSEWLDRLEGRPGEALRSLQSYDFLSPEAESKFRELVDGLRSQVMQQYFKGAEQALSNLTPEAVERTKAMLSELNDMIRRREDGQPYDFDGFMQRHGEFFPDNPRDLDQLLEGLARRMAMAQAMMASMSPEMRARLEEMMGALMADADLSFQMNELTHALRGMLPPGMWDRGLPFEGSDPLDMSRAMEVLERLQEAEDLEQYLRGVTRPGDLDEVDLDRVSSLLGPEAARDLKRLQEIERMLEDAGYVQRSRGRLDITPQGVRRIGRQALGSVYSRLKAALAGDHQIPRSGRGGDLTGETKPYEFGDPFHIEVKQTVFEAVRRSGAGTPVRIRPEDFQVERTEHRVQAATALLIDLSLSMPMRGNWVAAKKVALALHALISTMFPSDMLYVVGFSDYARRVHPEELPGLGWEEVYGTNLQHALLLARRQLSRHRQASRQIICVTDGEPTAHLEGSDARFHWPALPKTISETLKEVVNCTREGIVINTFMLDRSPDLLDFVQQMTALNKGRAFLTSPEHLGEYVLLDFLESKRSLLRGA